MFLFSEINLISLSLKTGKLLLVRIVRMFLVIHALTKNRLKFLTRIFSFVMSKETYRNCFLND